MQSSGRDGQTFVTRRPGMFRALFADSLRLLSVLPKNKGFACNCARVRHPFGARYSGDGLAITRAAACKLGRRILPSLANNASVKGPAKSMLSTLAFFRTSTNWHQSTAVLACLTSPDVPPPRHLEAKTPSPAVYLLWHNTHPHCMHLYHSQDLVVSIIPNSETLWHLRMFSGLFAVHSGLNM